jgi:hypothetical protein
MAVAPDAMAPADDLVLGVEIGLDLDRHRGTERRMGHLVLARPLHADRTAARRLRQQHGVERDVVGAVVAVTAGAFHVFDHDVLGRQFQDQRKIGPEQIDALAVGPDMDAVAAPLRHGTGRRDRPMRDIRPGILPPEYAFAFCTMRRRFGVDNRRFHRLALQPVRQPVLVGQRFTSGPHRGFAQRLQRGLRAVLGLTHYAHKISIADDRDKAGNAARSVVSQFHECRRRHLRSQHPAMQHCWQGLVVDEAGMRKHLVGNIHPLHGIPGKCAPGR